MDENSHVKGQIQNLELDQNGIKNVNGFNIFLEN